MAEVIKRTPRPLGGYLKLILWPRPEVQAADVSHRVIKELFVYSGEQMQVVAATISRRVTRPPSVTVATMVHSVLGDWRAANISRDDDNDVTFFIKLPVAGDVEKFHSHNWWWFQEFVSVRRVLRLNESTDITTRATGANFAP